MNTNFNTTNRNGVYGSGINSGINQYTLNGHIMVGSQDEPASDIDGAQSRARLLNSRGKIFEHNVYESMPFGMDEMQSSRIKEPQVQGPQIQEAALNRFNDVSDNEEGAHLTNLDVQDGATSS
ncbi:hypothetical protein BCON_0413g00030 [Botryotinia convoluta]|uniref:Uncharacterized protein n=1 Tax=Botryotinia convoluta TaxID=54673 RepID=A0A4Z1HEP5_9HELO|nr:hypothetical protein BCON_0413g00030 [Botryotinia convoluta]